MTRHIKSEAFAPVDAAWLHMDRKVNRMIITGVMTFDEPIDFERLQRVIECRFLCYDRFRQKVSEPLLKLGTPRWEFDRDFDIRHHLRRVALPKPGDHAMLQDLVSELMSTPLDYSRPLWQTHLVENYGKGCAVITRLHHAIADGIALVQVLLAMADAGPDAPEPAPLHPGEGKDGQGGMLKPVVRIVGRTASVADKVIHEGMETLVDPARVLDGAALGASGTRTLGKLLLIPPDHRTALKGKLRGEKRAAWSTMMDLEEVKAVGKAYDATVNDVLLTAVSGALRRYLIKRGNDVEGLNIRAMVPVNLRRPEEPYEKLGNRFGLVILSLPVGTENPFRRLRILKKRMDDIKNSPEAVITFGILSGMGLSPKQAERFIIDFFASKVSAVMTNVPGPRDKLYLAGKRMESVMFWVPTGGNISLGVSILSYAGSVILGIMADRARVRDPQTLIAAFQAEFEEMKRKGKLARARAARAKRASRPPRVPRARADGALECDALTKSGYKCRNRALPGTDRCALHSRAMQAKAPIVPAE